MTPHRPASGKSSLQKTTWRLIPVSLLFVDLTLTQASMHARRRTRTYVHMQAYVCTHTRTCTNVLAFLKRIRYVQGCSRSVRSCSYSRLVLLTYKDVVDRSGLVLIRDMCFATFAGAPADQAQTRSLGHETPRQESRRPSTAGNAGSRSTRANSERIEFFHQGPVLVYDEMAQTNRWYSMKRFIYVSLPSSHIRMCTHARMHAREIEQDACARWFNIS